MNISYNAARVINIIEIFLANAVILINNLATSVGICVIMTACFKGT